MWLAANILQCEIYTFIHLSTYIRSKEKLKMIKLSTLRNPEKMKQKEQVNCLTRKSVKYKTKINIEYQ